MPTSTARPQARLHARPHAPMHARRPHVKLFLLHLFFYLPLRPAFRRNGNYWLAFFGKWTLADVLVMCVLVGLLNLTASLDLPEVWRQLEPAFDGACATACAKLPPADDTTALSAAWGDATTPWAAVYESQPQPWAAIASGASPASPASLASPPMVTKAATAPSPPSVCGPACPQLSWQPKQPP